jgi:UDP-glucose 4-epimerase
MNRDDQAGPVWVTGAGGFIGQHLCRVLCKAGQRVVGFGLAAALPGQEPYFGGGLHPQTLAQAVAEYDKPRVVYHLAGGATVGQSIADPLQDFNKSVTSTVLLLDYLQKTARDASVVLASSAAVYGAGHDGPISISAACRPFSPYGFHKKIVEELGHSFHTTYGQPIAIVRLFSVYGEGLRKQLLWDLCHRLRSGEKSITLGGTGHESRDWCHISDVIALLQSVVPNQGDALKILNGGTGVATTIHDIASLVQREWGSSQEIGFSGYNRIGDPRQLVADRSCQPVTHQWTVPIAEGIPRYVNWFKTLPHP